MDTVNLQQILALWYNQIKCEYIVKGTLLWVTLATTLYAMLIFIGAPHHPKVPVKSTPLYGFKIIFHFHYISQSVNQLFFVDASFCKISFFLSPEHPTVISSANRIASNCLFFALNANILHFIRDTFCSRLFYVNNWET